MGKRPRFHYCWTFIRVILVILPLLIISGCGIRLIAAYDANTEEAIFKCAKFVDQFYGGLLEADEGKRQYAKFANEYVAIEAEINSLLLRNKVRSLNEDSVDIAEKILNLWKKYRGRHKNRDTYSTGNAELDRKRFERMFAYAARAEGAKKIGEGDE